MTMHMTTSEPFSDRWHLTALIHSMHIAEQQCPLNKQFKWANIWRFWSSILQRTAKFFCRDLYQMPQLCSGAVQTKRQLPWGCISSASAPRPSCNLGATILQSFWVLPPSSSYYTTFVHGLWYRQWGWVIYGKQINIDQPIYYTFFRNIDAKSFRYLPM